MPRTKKPAATRKTTQKTVPQKPSEQPPGVSYSFVQWIVSGQFVADGKLRVQNFLARRPHRSFRRTYRRDYVRSLELPGYWAFTHYVHATLWNNKKTFLYVALAYAVMTVTLVNISSETLYAQMRESVNATSGGAFNGLFGEISKTGLLLFAGITGVFNGTQAGSATQASVYGAMIVLLTWLTTVWLLRVILAGRRPKMRDGLYNAGAPIVSTLLVSAMIFLQLIPLALALFGYGAATASGLLEGGVEAMLFWAVAALLVMLSLYWITSTLIALVVVTLPGMYPMQALRTAGDLVVGRRLRILFRILWMFAAIVVAWAVIVIPIMMFDAWIKSAWTAISWLPLVPITWLMMGALTVVWAASYIYLLYRRIVEDDALPA